MPLDPVYRDVKRDWSDSKIEKAVENSDRMWNNQATFGDLAVLEGDAGPFRWFSSNFGGSRWHTGSRMYPEQYPEEYELREMVAIWASSDIPDIAGAWLCACSLDLLTVSRRFLRGRAPVRRLLSTRGTVCCGHFSSQATIPGNEINGSPSFYF